MAKKKLPPALQANADRLKKGQAPQKAKRTKARKTTRKGK